METNLVNCRYFRRNVCRLRPEGTNWQYVPIDLLFDQEDEQHSTEELTQISAGPSGLLWALTSAGRCIVRLGVTRRNLLGDRWIVLDAPSAVQFSSLSVGVDSVWAVSRTKGQLYFRTGVRGRAANQSVTCGLGHKWTSMGSEMSLVSVAGGDQVWAIDNTKQNLYYRSGVTSGELTGKLWKLVANTSDVGDVSGSVNSLGPSAEMVSIASNSKNEGDTESFSSASETRTIWIWLDARSCDYQHDLQPARTPNSPGSLSAMNSLASGQSATDSNAFQWKQTIVQQLHVRQALEMGPFMEKIAPANEHGTWIKTASCQFLVEELQQRPQSLLAYAFNNTLSHSPLAPFLTNVQLGPGPVGRFVDCHLELERSGPANSLEAGVLQLRYGDGSWSNTQLVHLAEINCIQLQLTDRKLWPTPLLAIYTQNRELLRLGFPSEKQTFDWAATMAAACDAVQQVIGGVWTCGRTVNLFTLDAAGHVFAGFVQCGHTRRELCERLDQQAQHLRQEQSKLLSKMDNLLDQTNEQQPQLPQSSNSHFDSPNHQVPTERYQLEQLEERLRHVEIQREKLIKRLDSLSVESHFSSDGALNLYLKQLSEGHFKEIACADGKVCWAITSYGVPYVYTGADAGYESEDHWPSHSINSGSIHTIQDQVEIEVFENQRWFPVQGFKSNLLPTDRPAWSDRSGLHAASLQAARLPGKRWEWADEWTVDCEWAKCDPKGWQYSLDFSMEFHPSKRITDCVRRRRWVRKAKFVCTGPWQPLDESEFRLRSISMCSISDSTTGEPVDEQAKQMVDSKETKVDNLSKEEDEKVVKQIPENKQRVFVWAISQTGDALCRSQVTSERPFGDRWIHVASSKSLRCVSVACQAPKEDSTHHLSPFIQAWALAEDGSVMLRHAISLEELAGSLWLNLETSPVLRFERVFAVPGGCLASTEQGDLLYRERVDRTYPEGVQWRVVPQHPQLRVNQLSCSADLKEIWATGWLQETGQPVICCNLNLRVDFQRNFHLKWNVMIRGNFGIHGSFDSISCL